MLPARGMQAVSDQLVDRALELGVNICTKQSVVEITRGKSNSIVTMIHSDDKSSNKQTLRAKNIIIATDGEVCKRLLSKNETFQFLADEEKPSQRSTTCLYYTFQGQLPTIAQDPILLINGEYETEENTEMNISSHSKSIINSICFPSVVNPGYVPHLGASAKKDSFNHICCVSILGSTMEEFREGGKEDQLDQMIRGDLCVWFPDIAREIRADWEFRGVQTVKKAQPTQYHGPSPANVHTGRDCTAFRGIDLPKGWTICGDHMQQRR